MLNNTKIRVKIGFEELAAAAYKQLIREGNVPYVINNEEKFEPKYSIVWRDVEKREGLSIEFYVREIPVEEEKPYEAGSWKDPELEKIIDEND